MAPLLATSLGTAIGVNGVRFVVVDRAVLAQCPALAGVDAALDRYRTLGGDDRFRVVDMASPAGP